MASKIANELNRLAREDLDYFGTDGSALLDLLDEYLTAVPEDDDDPELQSFTDEQAEASSSREGIAIVMISIIQYTINYGNYHHTIASMYSITHTTRTVIRIS